MFLISLFIVSSSCFFFSGANPSSSSCSTYVFRNKNTYTSCIDLLVLDSFIHWTFNESSGNLQIAYRHVHVTPSTWVAWGLNPNSKGMVGTQAFIAFQKADSNMRVYNLPIMGYRTDMLPGELSFKVKNLSASYLEDEIIIFASLTLPYNYTTLNQVWQDGQVVNDSPTMHKVTGPNVKSMATLDLLSGRYTKSSGSVNRHMTLKITHGVIYTISWGMMIPLGAVIARYLKVFQSQSKAWFIIHRACQSLSYIIGTSGFITGVILGPFSPGLTYTIHLTVGIILISLASFQVLVAYFCRPGKDHRYRIWWNAFHYVVGYATIGFSIYNC